MLFIYASDRIYYCGGSIISNTHILTVAHCCIPGATIKVGVGSEFKFELKKRDVKRVHVHPLFIYPNSNDIAILALKRSLIYSKAIQPVQLPHWMEEIPYSQLVNVTGWGLVNEFEVANRLQFAEISIVNITECSRMYEGNDSQSSYICAGHRDEGKSACVGDSGGPLVAHNVQYGIVSSGEDYCGPPALYTNVLHFRLWIQKVTGI